MNSLHFWKGSFFSSSFLGSGLGVAPDDVAGLGLSLGVGASPVGGFEVGGGFGFDEVGGVVGD